MSGVEKQVLTIIRRPAKCSTNKYASSNSTVIAVRKVSSTESTFYLGDEAEASNSDACVNTELILPSKSHMQMLNTSASSDKSDCMKLDQQHHVPANIDNTSTSSTLRFSESNAEAKLVEPITDEISEAIPKRRRGRPRGSTKSKCIFKTLSSKGISFNENQLSKPLPRILPAPIQSTVSISTVNTIESTSNIITTVVCKVCGWNFVDEEHLNRHTNEEHKTKETRIRHHDFTCHYCGKNFMDRNYLPRHFRLRHPEISSDIVNGLLKAEMSGRKRATCSKNIRTFVCYVCEKTFAQKWNLLSHMKKIHSQMDSGEVEILKHRKFQCPACNFKEHWVSNLNTHMQKSHPQLRISDVQKLTFVSESDFLAWKMGEEMRTKSLFVKKGNDKTSVIRYYCNRSGVFISRGSSKRSIKAQGSCRIGTTCPAFIKAVVTKTGIRVTYAPSHVGHGPESKYHQSDLLTSHSSLVHTKSMLKGGVNLSITDDTRMLLDDIRDNMPSPVAVRLRLLQQKILDNIDREFKSASSTNMSDESYNSTVNLIDWINMCRSEGSELVRFLKLSGETYPQITQDFSAPQSALESQDFLLVISTRYQTNTLISNTLKNCRLSRSLSSSIICLDVLNHSQEQEQEDIAATTNLYLITLIVVDEVCQGVPVAYCLCNRIDQNIVEIFLQTVLSAIQAEMTAIETVNKCSDLGDEKKNTISLCPEIDLNILHSDANNYDITTSSFSSSHFSQTNPSVSHAESNLSTSEPFNQATQQQATTSSSSITLLSSSCDIVLLVPGNTTIYSEAWSKVFGTPSHVGLSPGWVDREWRGEVFGDGEGEERVLEYRMRRNLLTGETNERFDEYLHMYRDQERISDWLKQCNENFEREWLTKSSAWGLVSCSLIGSCQLRAVELTQISLDHIFNKALNVGLRLDELVLGILRLVYFNTLDKISRGDAIQLSAYSSEVKQRHCQALILNSTQQVMVMEVHSNDAEKEWVISSNAGAASTFTVCTNTNNRPTSNNDNSSINYTFNAHSVVNNAISNCHDTVNANTAANITNNSTGSNSNNILYKFHDHVIVRQHSNEQIPHDFTHCALVCPECRVCVHSFSCSCADYTLRYLICKHIHYIVQLHENSHGAGNVKADETAEPVNYIRQGDGEMNFVSDGREIEDAAKCNVEDSARTIASDTNKVATKLKTTQKLENSDCHSVWIKPRTGRPPSLKPLVNIFLRQIDQIEKSQRVDVIQQVYSGFKKFIGSVDVLQKQPIATRLDTTLEPRQPTRTRVRKGPKGRNRGGNNAQMLEELDRGVVSWDYSEMELNGGILIEEGGRLIYVTDGDNASEVLERGGEFIHPNAEQPAVGHNGMILGISNGEDSQIETQASLHENVNNDYTQHRQESIELTDNTILHVQQQEYQHVQLFLHPDQEGLQQQELYLQLQTLSEEGLQQCNSQTDFQSEMQHISEEYNDTMQQQGILVEVQQLPGAIRYDKM